MCKGTFSPHQTNFHHLLPLSRWFWRRKYKLQVITSMCKQWGHAALLCKQRNPEGILRWGHVCHLYSVEYNPSLNLNLNLTWVHMKNICFSGLWCVTWSVMFQLKILCWGSRYISLPTWWHYHACCCTTCPVVRGWRCMEKVKVGLKQLKEMRLLSLHWLLAWLVGSITAQRRINGHFSG